MASDSASVSKLHSNDLIYEVSTKLYDRCAEDDKDTVFRQEDLLAMEVIPNSDVRILMQVAQRLCDEKLFKLVREGSVAGWMYRTVGEATKYRSLTYEQEMVYALIDDSGAEGIWSKNIKTRSNLHDSTMRAVLKYLENKHYITEMKSVEHMNRKMYIKASLTPSEKATGGPWYTDGELDEEFISVVESTLYKYIMDNSFETLPSKNSLKKSKKRPKGTTDKGPTSKLSSEEARALRDAALNPNLKVENDDERSAKRRKSAPDPERLLPFPAGYQGYPTLQDCTAHVEYIKVSHTTLTREEISQLLEVLCFDKKIEKVESGSDGVAYKAVKRSAREIEDGPSNGLTEAPCGRCPVFDLCEEGGPVAPSNCVYFKEWFEM